MAEEEENQQGDRQEEGKADKPRDPTEEDSHVGIPGPAISWEQDLDTYPLREPSEDPRWAMWVFWIWSIFTVGMIVFMLVLLVLGWYYD